MADMYEGIGDSASSESDQDSDPHVTPEITRYVPAIQGPLANDEFEYYYAEELVTLYHQLKDTCANAGWSLFEKLDFCEFCKHAYRWSSRVKPPC